MIPVNLTFFLAVFLWTFSANAEFFQVIDAGCINSDQNLSKIEKLSGERVFWNSDKNLVGFGQTLENQCKVVDFFETVTMTIHSSTSTDDGDLTNLAESGFLNFVQNKVSENCESKDSQTMLMGISDESYFYSKDISDRSIRVKNPSRCPADQELILFF